jgi:hypothetical protein
MSTSALRDPREVIREEPLMQRPIREALSNGPLTIPQLAECIGHPAEETVYWVMGMRRYGHLVELEEADDDGYFRYRNTDPEVES